MIELEQAVEKILAALPAPASECVPLADAYGRILAESIHATTSLPPFDNSAMDGYAVRAEDIAGANAQTPVTLKLAGRVAAGENFAGQLVAGECIRIFTGSPLPAGADAVVMQEDTRSSAETQTASTRPNAGATSPSAPQSGGEVVPSAQGEIQFLDSAQPWENVRFRGEDVKRDQIIGHAGEKLGAAHLAVFAAVGVAKLKVNRRPSVALLATGSELREPADTTPLAPGQIYESNRAALAPLIRAAGGTVNLFPIVPDHPDATRAALSRAFAENDIVVTCGGVSVGEMDFVKSAFEELGGQLEFWKVNIKPGRPFIFGRLGEKFLFGLPGNPVSAFVTFLLLARPALLRWQGAANVSLQTTIGSLEEPMANPDHRRHFIRVTVDARGNIRSAGTQASHMLSSLVSATGLIDVPPNTTLPAGITVQILRWE